MRRYYLQSGLWMSVLTVLILGGLYVAADLNATAKPSNALHIDGGFHSDTGPGFALDKISRRSTKIVAGANANAVLSRDLIPNGGPGKLMSMTTARVALQVSTTPCPDFDGNGMVDISDFLLFTEHFGKKMNDEGYDAKYDLDSNDAIGISDFLIFTNSFGKEVDCSGSGGGGSSGSPDLIVESPSVSDNTLTTGQSFTLRATVRNQGTGSSASTTLRYYQSSNSTISTSDTEVGTDSVGGLSASGTSAESISLNAPSSAGTYYYGACVASVSGEKDTDNNCSDGVRVTVSSSSGGGGGGSSQTCTVGLVLNPGDSCSGSTYSIRNDAGVLVLDGNIGGITMGGSRMSGGSVQLNNLILTRSGNVWTIVSLPQQSGGGGGGGGIIPDANLRAVIAGRLGKASGAPITPAEIATLTSIDAPDKGIRNLTGLEHATNLTYLNLDDNNISDISVLSNLTNLTDLRLNWNRISDISVLSNLTNLTRLELHQNYGNFSISVLSNLTNLTDLSLGLNGISDISVLSNLTNLTDLGLGGNSISDISVLSNLTNLTILNLWENNISDISPLVANTGLGSGDRVNVRRNPLSSASINTHIPALRSRGVTVSR